MRRTNTRTLKANSLTTSIKMVFCCEEAKTPNFYIATLLEGVASFLLMFIGGSVYVKHERPYPQSTIYEIALVFGALVTVLSQCLKDISKAHINPVISLGSLLTKRVSLLRGMSFIVFQFAGGKFVRNPIFFYTHTLVSDTPRKSKIIKAIGKPAT